MEGLQLDLTKMAGKGNANLTFDLRKVLPLKATGDVHSDLSMKMDMGGQTTAMLMKMDMNFGLESK
jgi:hypothetical protein